MKKKTFLSLATFFVVFFILVFTQSAYAYKIQKLTGLETKNDFVVGPGKLEINVKSGDKFVRELFITNRLGRKAEFKVEVEDIKGSQNPQETVLFLGKEKGPYSLKNFVHPQLKKFSLNHGERMILPVTVVIPNNHEPGGLYGSVVVTTSSVNSKSQSQAETAKTKVKLISRIGALFFIKVAGQAREDGFLQDFRTKFFNETGPINYTLTFQNKGNVHLNAYGLIDIKNICGKRVGEIKIDPFFIMPNSLRNRSIQWNKKWLFGRYTANLKLNRGYKNIIDEKTISFWVIPWKLILLIILLLYLIIRFFRWVGNKFEIRKKR
jgi:hypothetical protein